MSFVRDGYPWMALSGSIAILVLVTSVWRRSWSMWLLGYVLLVFAAWVAWLFRVPAPLAHHTAVITLVGPSIAVSAVAPRVSPSMMHAAGAVA